MAKRERTNNNIHNIIQKTKDRATQTPLKTKYNKYVVNQKLESILMISLSENLMVDSECFFYFLFFMQNNICPFLRQYSL